MHLTSVDLPAPFSPSSTWNCPAGTEMETSSSAVKLPKCFDMPTVETAIAPLMAFSRWQETVSARRCGGCGKLPNIRIPSSDPTASGHLLPPAGEGHVPFSRGRETVSTRSGDR